MEHLEFGILPFDQQQEYILGHQSVFLTISMRYIATTTGITGVLIKLKDVNLALQDAMFLIGALTTGSVK